MYPSSPPRVALITATPHLILCSTRSPTVNPQRPFDSDGLYESHAIPISPTYLLRGMPLPPLLLLLLLLLLSQLTTTITAHLLRGMSHSQSLERVPSVEAQRSSQAATRPPLSTNVLALPPDSTRLTAPPPQAPDTKPLSHFPLRRPSDITYRRS